MSDVPQEWRQVTEAVSGLALKLKLHLEQAATDDDRAEARQALERLGDAVEDAFDAVRSAVKDPAVKDDAREVGAALKGALAATFAEARRRASER